VLEWELVAANAGVFLDSARPWVDLSAIQRQLAAARFWRRRLVTAFVSQLEALTDSILSFESGF